jgi:phage terminase large subunit
MYPKEVCQYNQSQHKYNFKNKSTIEFGHLEAESDVSKYQSAEYDVIRFDELTHFSSFQYTYMISRIRGANKFPKQIKSTSNPGSQGHQWVKEKFIDGKEPQKEYIDDLNRSSIFIPAKVTENKFLMDNDPQYIQRLEQLPEAQRKALLYGDWDIYEGQYFPEFNRDIHVIEPFTLPKHWKRFISLDYGLDMTAAYWWAVDEQGREYIYRELHEPNLTLTKAADKIQNMTSEDIRYIVASPDLWNRRQETGHSGMEIMMQSGLRNLTKADNDRINGWRVMREHLSPFTDEEGNVIANLRIFKNCVNLIKYIPMLQHDEHRPEDASDKPHIVTHSCITGDTIIHTVDGDKQMKDLVNTTGDLYCYDLQNKCKVISSYKDARLTRYNADIYQIETEDGRFIKATNDHRILTQDGWKKVCELSIDDEIVDITLCDMV